MSRPIDVVDEKWGDQEKNNNNLKIVSSDDVTFFIPLYYLQAASPIFRQKIVDSFVQPGKNHLIHFTDIEFENSAALRLVFDILDGSHHTPTPPSFELLRQYDAVLFFSKKWDSPALRHFVLSNIQNQCHRSLGSGMGYVLTETFAIAARHDEVHICATLINHRTGLWGDKSVSERGVSMGYDTLNPKSWPLVWVRRIPAEYLWALSTVMEGYTDTAHPKYQQRYKMATDFVRLVAEWQAPEE